MKHIVVIEGDFVRDTQVFMGDMSMSRANPDWDNHFCDLKYPCHYIGVFEGADEKELRNNVASMEGVHPDILTLIEI